jgi:lysophospholipase L1-like esterase
VETAGDRPVGVTRRAGLTALATAALAAGCSAAPARPKAPTPPAAPPVRIMIVGDSITHESAGDYTWRYRIWQHLQLTAPGRAHFVGDRDDVWDNVADRGGCYDYADPHFDRWHHARWGDSLRDETPVIGEVVRAHPADLMMIAIGANDLSYWTVPVDTATLLRRFLDNVRAVNPAMTFVIGHVLDREDFSNDTMNLPNAPIFNTILDTQAASWSTSTSRVLVADTDRAWNPLVHAWDGSHPTSDGEMIITRGFADALAGLGLGKPFGPLPAHIPWPGVGRAPTAVPVSAGSGRYALAWAATPGATQYVVERQVVSWGEPGFLPQGGGVAGYSWTTDHLLPGVTVAYRVVPWKGRMPGHPGRATTFTVGALP